MAHSLLIATCMTLFASAQRAADTVDVERVLRSHSSAIDQIATLQCRLVIREGLERPAVTVEGDYCRSSSFIHVKEKHSRDGRVAEIVARDGIITSLSRMGQRAVVSKTSTRETFCVCDVWNVMLLDFQSRGPVRLALADLLRTQHRRQEWKFAPYKERRVARLEFEFEDPDFRFVILEVDFDPECNYLARQVVIRHGLSPDAHVKKEIEEFEQPIPGCFFPVRSSSTLFVKGTAVSGMQAVASDVRINEALPVAMGVVSIPDGATLIDRIAGKTYTTDAHGNPKDQPVDVDVAPSFVNPSKLAGKLALPTKPVQRRRDWIVPAIVIALALATAASFIWLKTRARNSPPHDSRA